MTGPRESVALFGVPSMFDSLEVKVLFTTWWTWKDSEAQRWNHTRREAGAGKKRGAKTRADEQEPDRRPTVAGEQANDCEAHIYQAHWW